MLDNKDKKKGDNNVFSKLKGRCNRVTKLIDSKSDQKGKKTGNVSSMSMQIGGASRQQGAPSKLSKDLFGKYNKRMSNEFEASDFSPLNRKNDLKVSISLKWFLLSNKSS